MHFALAFQATRTVRGWNQPGRWYSASQPAAIVTHYGKTLTQDYDMVPFIVLNYWDSIGL